MYSAALSGQMHAQRAFVGSDSSAFTRHDSLLIGSLSAIDAARRSGVPDLWLPVYAHLHLFKRSQIVPTMRKLSSHYLKGCFLIYAG